MTLENEENIMNELGQSLNPLKVISGNAELRALGSEAGRTTRPVTRKAKSKTLAGLIAEVQHCTRQEERIWFLMALSASALLALSFWF